MSATKVAKVTDENVSEGDQVQGKDNVPCHVL